LLLCLGRARDVPAALISVPGDHATIQAAIDAASEGDTVAIDPGTYPEHDISFRGKGICVRSLDPLDPAVVAATVVDGMREGPVFAFESDEDSTSVLSGMTIVGGLGDAPYPQYQGGGMTFRFTSPSIDHCVIRNNWATDQGGGIRAVGSSARIRFCTIRNNHMQSFGEGAALYASASDVLLEGCTIAENTAPAGVGEAITCEGNTTIAIRNCVIANNTPGSLGGAIMFNHSFPTLSDVIIEPHDASFGGAINCRYSDPVLTNVTITDNTAEKRGGAINLAGSSHATLTNCILARNQAEIGAAIGDRGEGFDAYQCVFVDNTAADTSAAIETADADKVSLSNCILWGSSPAGLECISGSPTIRYSDIEGGWPGAGNIDADPRFRSFRGFEYLPGLGSPCIDAGDPATLDGISDFHPRWPAWYPDGPRSDIGAYGGPCNVGWLGFGCDVGGERRAP